MKNMNNLTIKIIEFDSEHYATNLTQKADTLKWESVGATHFMIVRAPFGKEIKLSDLDFSSLDNLDALNSGETKLNNEAYLTLFPRSGVNVHKVTVKPATYAIYACCYEQGSESENDTGVLTIYNPNEACFYQCAVLAKVRVTVKKAPIPEKSFFEKLKSIFNLFKRKQPERRYYNVGLPEIPDYKEGLLCYGYNNCDLKFPITKKMLNKTILIPESDENPPIVESLNSKAYKIVIER